MLNIRDRRYIVVRDVHGNYSDTDREMWMGALGADQIRRIGESSSGILLLVHFPTDSINLRDIANGFNLAIDVSFKGTKFGTFEGEYLDNVIVPIYVIDEFSITGTPA